LKFHVKPGLNALTPFLSSLQAAKTLTKASKCGRFGHFVDCMCHIKHKLTDLKAQGILEDKMPEIKPKAQAKGASNNKSATQKKAPAPAAKKQTTPLTKSKASKASAASKATTAPKKAPARAVRAPATSTGKAGSAAARYRGTGRAVASRR